MDKRRAIAQRKSLSIQDPPAYAAHLHRECESLHVAQRAAQSTPAHTLNISGSGLGIFSPAGLSRAAKSKEASIPSQLPQVNIFDCFIPSLCDSPADSHVRSHTGIHTPLPGEVGKDGFRCTIV